MRLDTGLTPRALSEVPAAARAAEAAGFDALWTMESGNDPFLTMALVAEHTSRIKLGTAVAIAFPRSPMVTAQTAWDLAGLSHGRFILGLGTQVKGHIERRYSVHWEAPVARLDEYVRSLRAIFKSWAEGGKHLAFQGKYYNFSLMTPFFTPPRHDFSQIPIFIAGVNRRICRLAGEVCDGLHAHPFNSPKYLREVVVPAIEAGLNQAGRKRADFSTTGSVFVIAGRNRAEIEQAREAARAQIAFYASTRSYRIVLETHGWGDVAPRLNQKAARGEWASMAREITDEMLDTYAVSGGWDEIGRQIKERYEGLLDRVAFYLPYRVDLDTAAWGRIAAEFNG